MSMSSMLAAIAAKVKLELPALRECRVHDGQFTDVDMRRYVTQAPAVYVSCLGSNDDEDQGDDLVAIAQWVMVIVTRRTHNEGDEATRTMTALDLVEQLMFLVRNNGSVANSWASETNQPATKIRSRNLFNEESDKRGVGVWAITWDQAVSVGQFVDPDELDDFLTAQTSFELTDSTGALTSERVFTTTVQEVTP